MNIIAHRGYSDLAPENTLPSFDLAIKKGFNIFELDIQLTKDKVPIVFHDYDLNRICGLNLKINEIEFNSIEDFDVGVWKGDEFKNEIIPSFEKILIKYKNRTHLQIELKSHEKELAKLVIDLLAKTEWHKLSGEPYDVPGFSITSFDFNNLIEVRKISNDMRAGWLLNYEKHNLDEILKLLQLHNINMLIPNVDDQIWDDNYFIDKLKNSGYTLCAWGAKSTSDVIKMNNLGISGMTVNWPAKASKVIE